MLQPLFPPLHQRALDTIIMLLPSAGAVEVIAASGRFGYVIGEGKRSAVTMEPSPVSAWGCRYILQLAKSPILAVRTSAVHVMRTMNEHTSATRIQVRGLQRGLGI